MNLLNIDDDEDHNFTLLQNMPLNIAAHLHMQIAAFLRFFKQSFCRESISTPVEARHFL